MRSIIHTSAVLLLTLVFVSSCSLFQAQPLPQKVKIYTVPVITKPIIPAAVEGPPLELPEILVTTAKDVEVYQDVCDDYKSGDYNAAQMKKRDNGLSRSAACDWALYGFTVQGWLNLESQISEISTYTRSLRARIEVLEGMLQDQYDASIRQREALEAINEDNE